MLNEYPSGMWFLLCSLATWRLTHLVVAEDGPWEVIVRIRAWFGDSVVGQAMDCFYCSSVWLAMPFAFVIADDFAGWLVSWLAISGAASLLEQATNRELNHGRQPKLEEED